MNNFYCHPCCDSHINFSDLREYVKHQLSHYLDKSELDKTLLEILKEYSDKIIEDVVKQVNIEIVQELGNSTEAAVSQATITRELNKKVNSIDLDNYVKQSQIVQTTGQSTTSVMSQKAVTDALNDIISKCGCNTNNEYKYVDLGLPSGNLWCTKNVGAKTETDAGLYFAWGETQGYVDNSERKFTWDAYKFGGYLDQDASEETGIQPSKYNKTDGLKTLELEDDAAYVNMGKAWKMASIKDWEELAKYTTGLTSENDHYVENYNGSGVNGFLLKSKINGNTIFFPETKIIDDEDSTSGKHVFGVWSSELGYVVKYWFAESGCGEYMSSTASNNDLYFTFPYYRFNGLTVRGILREAPEENGITEDDIKKLVEKYFNEHTEEINNKLNKLDDEIEIYEINTTPVLTLDKTLEITNSSVEINDIINILKSGEHKLDIVKFNYTVNNVPHTAYLRLIKSSNNTIWLMGYPNPNAAGFNKQLLTAPKLLFVQLTQNSTTADIIVDDNISRIIKDIIDSPQEDTSQPIITKTLFIKLKGVYSDELTGQSRNVSYDDCTGSFVDVWKGGNFDIWSNKIIMSFDGGSYVELNNKGYHHDSLYASAIFIPHNEQTSMDNCRFLIVKFNENNFEVSVSQIQTTNIQ